ncbi:(S)-canadine synthase CYP719A21-like [Cryptomeria japonica]|uniref:(S)-canadine synthase CYP719A21-like n=1 Tax=Cryptomeria japonica TaxID=3369 RepID=UPI0027DA99CB|nr:(S)-canadine synthase CYP719A21-like [Cryptomeria japonica]
MASLSSQATVIGQPSSDNQRHQFSFEPDRYGHVIWPCNDRVDGAIAYDRPTLYSGQYTTASFKTIVPSPCNERWTKLRKLLHNNVLSPFHVASQSTSHQAYVVDLFSTLAMGKEANDGVVRPLQALKMMGMSFLARLCFGPHFQDQGLLVMLNELVAERITLGGERDNVLLNSFPYTRYFIPSSKRAVKKWKSHRAAILQLFLPSIQFTRSDREVRRVVEEKGELLCLKDLGKLPYLQAVAKETLRKESIAPLAIKEPDQFIPERFPGNMDSDKVRMWYLPFGAGRRVCAGMDLANVHVPITLANLLLKFEWACVKEGCPPDLTRHIPSLLMSMKYPLEAHITCR